LLHEIFETGAMNILNLRKMSHEARTRLARANMAAMIGRIADWRKAFQWRRLITRCIHFEERRRERVREYQRQRKEMVWRERRARRRALVLLLRQLNSEQRREFRQYGYFYVRGGRSGQRYRIRTDLIANIDVFNRDDTIRHRLCVHLAEGPLYDMMAAQCLHLQDPETEQEFLRHANIHLPISKGAYYAHS